MLLSSTLRKMAPSNTRGEHQAVGPDAGAAEHALDRHRTKRREQLADEFGVQGGPYMLVLDAWTDLRSSAYSVPPVAAPRM